MQDIVYNTPYMVYTHNRREHPRNSHYYLHAHDSYELLYFVEGGGRYLVEGREYPVGPDCVLVMRPGEVHRLLVDESSPYERVCINFHSALLQETDPEGLLLGLFDHRPLGEQNRYVVNNGEELRSLLPTEEECTATGVLAARVFLLRCLFELYRQQARTPSGEDTPLLQVLPYINRHLTEELSLSAVADRFYISPAQLNRRMKQSVGTTFWQYVQVKRLLLAQSLLRQGHSPGEAAFTCGFGEYSAFYRAYTRQFGHSPRETRGKGFARELGQF